jgi:hypothetical protein
VRGLPWSGQHDVCGLTYSSCHSCQVVPSSLQYYIAFDCIFSAIYAEGIYRRATFAPLRFHAHLVTARPRINTSRLVHCLWNLLICLFSESNLATHQLKVCQRTARVVSVPEPLPHSATNDTAPHSGFNLVTALIPARKDETLRDPLSSLSKQSSTATGTMPGNCIHLPCRFVLLAWGAWRTLLYIIIHAGRGPHLWTLGTSKASALHGILGLR